MLYVRVPLSPSSVSVRIVRYCPSSEHVSGKMMTVKILRIRADQGWANSQLDLYSELLENETGRRGHGPVKRRSSLRKLGKRL